MTNKLKTVVLVSGAGSNLHHFVRASRSGQVQARVLGVGCDRPCRAQEVARELGLPFFIVKFSDHPSRELWGGELLERVFEYGPDLVILSGFMRLLPPNFIRAFFPYLINTHPAFLPEFPGACAVADALAAGVSETGASVIIASLGVDDGPILIRRRVRVDRDDDRRSLHSRIKIVERDLLIKTVNRIAKDYSALVRIYPRMREESP